MQYVDDTILVCVCFRMYVRLKYMWVVQYFTLFSFLFHC